MATIYNWMSRGYDWLHTLNMFDDEELNTFEKNPKADLKLLLADKQDTDEEDIAAYKRGFDWALNHGWIDED